MIIKTIILPTPRRIKKTVNRYLTAERIVIYTLIGTGIAIISLNSIPVKAVPIATLIYCGFAYEIIDGGIIENSDPELIEYLLETNFYYRAFNWFY